MCQGHRPMHLPGWATELLPLAILLATVVTVVSRLPKVDLGHSKAFERRRVLNWLPAGLTYAFLYMGRYNLSVCTDKAIGALTYDQFSDISSIGKLVYGLSFLLNGPLTDRLGGRATIILAAAGSGLANLGLGFLVLKGVHSPSELHALQALYAVNMYFQSFGAVSIVKVNSAWFHIRERGTFGGIFGILISLGLYFAYDWCNFIAKKLHVGWAFWVPSAILLAFAAIDTLLVRDQPSDAGHPNFPLGDASESDDGPALGPLGVAKKMFTNPAILLITAVEFCSGFLRTGIMDTYKPFADAVGRKEEFVRHNWGILNCTAGILGGVFAGVISDRIFQSRRGPVSAVLYGVMVVGTGVAIGTLVVPGFAGWPWVLMLLAIIGVHGMLSGTASMDFGGKKNTGVAVGLIDGFVYFGGALGQYVLKHTIPADKSAAAGDPKNWWTWPATLLPVAIVGFLLTTRLWNAKPSSKASAH